MCALRAYRRMEQKAQDMSFCQQSYQIGYRAGFWGGFLIGIIVASVWAAICFHPFR